jgi:DNA repair photolyase
MLLNILVKTTPENLEEKKYKLTRSIIEILIENDLPFTLLTKSDLILRDIDLLEDYEWCRAGFTLTSSNEKIRAILEPGAVSYEDRVEALNKLNDCGISTYVSCEPIMPIKEANILDIVLENLDVVDLFEFGKWNRYRYRHLDPYFYVNYSDDYYCSVFDDLIFCCEYLDIDYCIASHSKSFFEDNGYLFKPYPLIKDGLY